MRVETGEYASPTGEDKDCAVRALMAAAGLGYAEAHAAFERHGRMSGQGTPHEVTEAVIAELFPGATKLELSVENLMRTTGRPRMTLPEFVSRIGRRGKWIVHVKGHALAVTDGVVHDWRGRPATRVSFAWQIGD